MAALLSTADLAVMLGVSDRQIAAYRRDGMPAVKAGRTYQHDPAACRAWIRRSKHTALGGKRPGAGRPKTGVTGSRSKTHSKQRNPKPRKGKASKPDSASPPPPPPSRSEPSRKGGGGGASGVSTDDLDHARASMERLLAALPPTATAADARTLKDLLGATLADLDVRKRTGELVEVADMRVSLARTFTSAERYLDTSRRPTALSIAEDLGLPHDQAGAIEERIAARDDEFRRRMRRGADAEEIEA